MRPTKFLLLLVIATFVFVQGCHQEPTVITGEQMLYIQLNMIENMEPILDNMTDVYSDYLAFNKSESEFLKDIESLKYQYKQIENNYAEISKKYVLADDADKKVLDALKHLANARQAVWNILNNSTNNGKILSRVELLLLYTEQGNIIQQNMEEFTNIILELYDNSQSKTNNSQK